MTIGTMLKVLIRHWWLIVLVVVMTVGATFFSVSRKPAIYRAEALVELKPHSALTDPDTIIDTMEALERRTIINTLSNRVTSRPVQEAVAAEIGVAFDMVEAANLSAIILPETNLIEIRAQSTNANQAATIANTTADVLMRQLAAEAAGAVLQLNMVSAARPPVSPVAPQPMRLLTLSVVLGGVLGVLLAMLSHTIQQPAWLREAFGLDEDTFGWGMGVRPESTTSRAATNDKREDAFEPGGSSAASDRPVRNI